MPSVQRKTIYNHGILRVMETLWNTYTSPNLLMCPHCVTGVSRIPHPLNHLSGFRSWRACLAIAERLEGHMTRRPGILCRQTAKPQTSDSSLDAKICCPNYENADRSLGNERPRLEPLSETSFVRNCPRK